MGIWRDGLRDAVCWFLPMAVATVWVEIRCRAMAARTSEVRSMSLVMAHVYRSGSRLSTTANTLFRRVAIPPIRSSQRDACGVHSPM